MAPQEAVEPRQEERMDSGRKTKVGRVVSDKMDKTVVVAVDSYKKHRLYNKPMRVTRRFKAHDETNECREGDVVRIVESRPLSKEKHWVVGEILERGKQL